MDKEFEELIRRQLESAPTTEVAGIGEFDPTDWDEEKEEVEVLEEPETKPIVDTSQAGTPLDPELEEQILERGKALELEMQEAQLRRELPRITQNTDAPVEPSTKGSGFRLGAQRRRNDKVFRIDTPTS